DIVQYLEWEESQRTHTRPEGPRYLHVQSLLSKCLLWSRLAANWLQLTLYRDKLEREHEPFPFEKMEEESHTHTHTHITHLSRSVHECTHTHTNTHCLSHTHIHPLPPPHTHTHNHYIFPTHIQPPQ